MSGVQMHQKISKGHVKDTQLEEIKSASLNATWSCEN